MDGIRSPSAMEKRKVLSHSKLHNYLKVFSSMGFLIRNRLPKRGNYVEYHLNRAFASQHPFWRHFFLPRTNGDDYGPQLWHIPLISKGRIERQKWLSKKRVRKKLQARWEKEMKEIRFLTVKMRSPVTVEDEYRYLRDYRLLLDLAPHKPSDTKKIIIGLKQQIFCPECFKRISLQRYLQEGIDCIPRLLRIKAENKTYCPKCYYETQYEPSPP